MPRAQRATWEAIAPTLHALDLAAEVPRLAVPVWLALARHDLVLPPEPALAWLDALVAPRREVVWFERAGHAPPVEEPAAFAALLARVRASLVG